LAFTFMNLRTRLEEMRRQMVSELADNPFAGLANLTAQAIRMQWGWGVLIVGVLLVLLAAALELESQNQYV